MTTETNDQHSAEELEETWSALRKAGGRQAYVEQELERRGLAVQRRETQRMSKRELGEYKRALKAEAAERKSLMKATWRAYFKHHVVHLGDDIFWSDEWDFDKYDHPLAEERAAENDLPKLEKPEHLAEALGASVAELRWLTFHRDAATQVHYERFTIPKRSGGVRAIWAPRPKLKAAQRWVLREVVERLPVHGAAHGFIPGRSTFTNAREHTNSDVVVKMDLRDFFPTVTLPRAKGVFRKAGYREQIATLLALLCTESPREVVDVEGETYYVAMGPRCLPQGAPTSPMITNALCLRLDRRLTGYCQKMGWRYTRYADDLTFSWESGEVERGPDAPSEPAIGKLIGAVHFITGDEGFVVHPDKTRVLRDGARQQVTGLIVNGPGEPRVPRETRRMLRAAQHNVSRGKPLQAGETMETLLGYAAYVYMTDRELGAELLSSLRELG